MNISPDVVDQIAIMLGRQPRGLEDVAVAGARGEPLVIRVATLVDDAPFPTLFWLIDPSLCYRIDQAEASGQIKVFQHLIDADPVLQEAMRDDHLAYIALRAQYMSAAIRQRIDELGYYSMLEKKGIGGIGDFSRIRCLHTWYGAHLVVPNTVGGMLDDWWQQQST